MRAMKKIVVKAAGVTAALAAAGVLVAGFAALVSLRQLPPVDALRDYGVRHIDMPATPLRVWEAIQAAGRRS